MIFFIFIGTLPFLLTLPLSAHSMLLKENTVFVGAAMIAMGVVLFVADRQIKIGKLSDKTMRSKDAFIIGLAQGAQRYSRPVAHGRDGNNGPCTRL